MYTRFRDSLINPRLIVDFRNDHIVLVILYVIFFALLLSTRTVIDTATFDGLTPAEKEVLTVSFQELPSSCGIEDAIYVCDQKQTTLFYETVVANYYFESNDELQFDQYVKQYNIVVYQDSVLFVFSNSVVYEYLISDLDSGIHNLDFSTQSTNMTAFHTQIFDAIDTFILSQRGVWMPLLIIMDILSSMFLFFVFIVISAFMMRMRFRQIRFKHLFVMTAYSSTTLYVILIFNSLYNLNIFLIILLIFFAFRQNNQLSIELMRRLQKKP